MARILRPHSRDGFEIAIICALPIERDAVEALLDKEYETDGFSYGKAPGDRNAYTTGRLGNQHVVLAYIPGMGTTSAAAVAAHLCSSFEGIKVGMVVGICGGVPTTAGGGEILLGDVIISTSVIQIDFGRQYPNKFIRKKEVEDTLGRANQEIRSFIGRVSGYLVQRRLKDKTSLFSAQICAKEGFSNSAYPGPGRDILYPADYRHKHQIPGPCICNDYKNQDDDICESTLRSSCEELGCDDTLSTKRSRIQRAMGFAPDGSPMMAADIQEAQKPCIHFGRMSCSNQVMKSGQHRDRIAEEEEVIGFEMESAGTWDFVPTIVIKSVCDYADSHKNKEWQQYAAATAAAGAKALLEEWRSVDRPIQNLINQKDLG
jgi:nucleoside phosphorylase